MYNHNKAQQSSNRVNVSWDILYNVVIAPGKCMPPAWYQAIISSNADFMLTGPISTNMSGISIQIQTFLSK